MKKHKKLKAAESKISNITTADICSGIMFLVNQLKARGVYLYDFDDKTRHVDSIMIIKNTPYIMAVKEDTQDEKRL